MAADRDGTLGAASAGEPSRYHPRPAHARRGIALCLSGGGYRALLFHLGALTRLNQLGVLSSVTTISAVSGGSILAAAMAHRIETWPEPGDPIEQWESRLVTPMLAFTKRNLRNGPIARRYALPWNWGRRHVAVEALAQAYEQHLTDKRLTQLPERPRFIFSATDMVFGVNWVFDTEDSGRAGDYRAGYIEPMPPWPLARAVAASSCFPPVFDPLRLELDPAHLVGGDYVNHKDRDRLVADISLSDGGVYDNLGTEPVWKDHATVLVSDGGAVFGGESDRGAIWRLQRYVAIASNQGSALRKRWLISNMAEGRMRGAYWGLGSTARHYGGAPGYPGELVESSISSIRTDLDRFTDAEQGILINHGYLLAEAAAHRHVPELIADDVPSVVPYPHLLDVDLVSKALKHSAKHRVFRLRK